MAEQEEGWPLGLQPLNMRGGLVRNHNNFSGSISFNTLLSGTPTSSSSSPSDSSFDLDTESTGSFFQDRSITLGSLIGVSRVVEISRRSARGRSRRPDHHHQTSALSDKKTYNKSKTWCFSLCPRDNTEVEIANNNTIPLGQFLAVERRAATEHRRSHSPLLYGPDELSMAQAYRETNSLFINGQIAPLPAHRSSSSPYSSSENAEITSVEGDSDVHMVPSEELRNKDLGDITGSLNCCMQELMQTQIQQKVANCLKATKMTGDITWS